LSWNFPRCNCLRVLLLRIMRFYRIYIRYILPGSFMKIDEYLHRSGFKTFNQVQSQGGPMDSNAGIYLIFRVLNPSVQHRNWA